MPSWGNYLIFPLHLIGGKGGPGAEAGREWLTHHLRTDGADVFNSRLPGSYWQISLAGLTLTPSQAEEWDAFVDAAEGMAKPVLFRLNSSRFAITNELVGTGDGATTAFQLKKTRSYERGPANSKSEVVKFPWHDYPPFVLPGGSTLLGTEYVTLKGGSTPETATPLATGWSVNRESGVITFDAAPANGLNIYATCKFLILVHMMDWMPLKSEGGAHYEFSQNAVLFQAKGGGV